MEKIPRELLRPLKEDKVIELSCGSFEYLKDLITRIVRERRQQIVYNVNDAKPFPGPITIANLADKTYVDLDKDESTCRDNDWKLLTTARGLGRLNGYFGAMFINSNDFHVVIAHRGTKPTTVGAIVTDISGVLNNSFCAQMDSACTFVTNVDSILRRIEDNDTNVRFQMFLTGHSLGGWLAQITSFAAEYLKIQDGHFVRETNEAGKRHAHTVVFDSPGCEPMLSQMKTKFGIRYEYHDCSLKDLDITTYFLYYNIFNATNKHVGTLYQIGNQDERRRRCALGTHRLKGIITALEGGIPFQVKYWPMTTLCRRIFQFLFSILRIFPILGSMVPYNTCELTEILHCDRSDEMGDFGGERHKREQINTCKRRLQAFTKNEKLFLEMYALLRRSAIQSKTDKIFACIENKEHRADVHQSLKSYTIDRDHNCCENTDMEKFIPYIQQLLHRHPEIYVTVKEQLREYDIRKEFYNIWHLEFKKEIKKFDLRYKDAIEPQQFRVWQVITESSANMHISTMKTYNHVPHNKDDIIMFNLKQLLHLEGFASIMDLTDMKVEKDHLFIIECEPISDLCNDEVEDLLELIIRVVNGQPSVKFIFITVKNDQLTTIVRDKYTRLGETFRQTECDLKWEDLTVESQYKLLEKKAIRLGKKVISLNDFVNISSDEWGKNMHCDLIPRLINGEITLSKDRMSSSSAEVSESEIYQEMPEASLQHFFSHCPEESLFRIKSNGLSKVEVMERLNVTKELAKKLDNKIILTEDLECEEFRRNQCQKQVFLLEVSADRVMCQKIYNPNFYFPRLLQLFDFKQELKLILDTKNDNTSDAFVISGITEKQFVHILKISENTMKECVFFCTAETAESTFNEKREFYASVHWMKVDDKEQIFWYRSNGPLKSLRKHYSKESKNPANIDEETFLKDDSQYKDKIVIIAGDPGMGKSTSLIKFMENRDVWMIHRELRSCHEQMSDLDKLHKINLDNVVEFLCKTDSELSERSLLKLLLSKGLARETRIPIHVMFDGFDELKETAQQGFLKLAQFLKENTKCNVWVTTRSHCRDVLEDTLSTVAITFTEVDEEWQDVFLRKYFQVHYAFHFTSQGAGMNAEIDKYVAHILSQAKRIFHHETPSFMGVPLQLRILAEVCSPIMAGSEQGQIRDFENFADLLWAFVQKKFDAYLKKITGLNAENSALVGESFLQFAQKTHRDLGFSSVFGDATQMFLHSENSDLKKWLQVGVIKSLGSDRFGFVHQRFAEYFSADMMVHWFKNPDGRRKPIPVEDFILSEILMKPQYKDIRLLIDDLLGKCSEQNAEVQLSNDRIAACLVENQEKYYNCDHRTVFYIAIEENMQHIFEFLLSCFKDQREDLAKLLSSRDKNRKTVLYVAAEKLNLSQLKGRETSQFLKRCLECVEDVDVSTQTTLILATCFRTAQDNSNQVIKTILKVVDGYPHLQSIVIAAKKMWEIITPFHNSVSTGNIEDIKIRLDEAGDRENGQHFRKYLIVTTNKGNKTALYLAVKNGRSDILKLLIEEGADINSSCDLPLHTAVQNGHIAVVTQLLEMGANIQATDDKKRTPLHYAVSEGKRDIVNELLDNGAYAEIATEEKPFCCLPEIFEMNAKPLDENLLYCLYPMQDAEMPGDETSDIAECYQMVIQNLKTEFGPHHKNTLAAQGMLAKEWCRRRNYQQALDTYRNVLNDIPNDSDPNDAMQTMVSIAQLLCKQGEYDDALSVYADIFARRSQILEPNHQDVFLARLHIAKILSFQGKYDESLAKYRELDEDLSHCRSKYHESLMTRHNTAQLLAHMGQYEGSFKLFKFNEEKFTKSFRNNHNFTLITQLNIAQVLANMGKCKDAIPYYDICMKYKNKIKPGSEGETFESVAKCEKAKVEVYRDQLANNN